MKRYITPQDVQECLGISRTSTYKLINKKDFPMIKIGHNIRIDEEEFYKWMNANLGRSIEL